MTRLALLLVLLLGTAPLAAGAEEAAAATEPEATIERLYAALLDVMKKGDALGEEARKQALAPELSAAYDLPFMSAKVLGRHFRRLSDEDQLRWIDLFTRLTVATYADRFKSYSGEKLEVLGSQPASRETVVVRTYIVPSGEEPVSIDYRMHERAGGWRVADVYLNGTVSELALRRSEYSSVLKRDGFETLFSEIEAKLPDPADDGPAPVAAGRAATQ